MALGSAVSIRAVDGSERGARVSVGGNVITYRPGGFCLWCIGYLSDEKLALARGGPARGYARQRDGAPADAQVVRESDVKSIAGMLNGMHPTASWTFRSAGNQILFGLERALIVWCAAQAVLTASLVPSMKSAPWPPCTCMSMKPGAR